MRQSSRLSTLLLTLLILGLFTASSLHQPANAVEEYSQPNLLENTTVPPPTDSTPSSSDNTDPKPQNPDTDKDKETHHEIEEQEEQVEEKKEEKLGEALVLYFVLVCMLIGAILHEIKKKLGIPYTPMLLIVGIVIGTITDHLGDFGTSVDAVMHINPRGILFIFIPTLVFESAFNIDPFIFKRSAAQIIILAVPGVIIGSIINSIFFRYVLGYGSELSWSGCMTFSAILSATDPVAVVALLKELGTPLRFNVLLEGESLLNDGTAMVFYLVFASIYKGLSGTVVDSLIQFIRLTLGGTAVGLLVWYLITQWIRRIVRDQTLITNLTFLACYFAFFICEFYLEVSGIIAIVVLGIAFSISGKSKIHPESESAIHSVWTYVQYVMETVIFLLSGCFIGKDLLLSVSSSISRRDVICAIIFFFLMTLGRYLMLLILRPALNLSGYHIDHKKLVVLTYGGLRGAIALCLGLMVTTDITFPARFRDLVIFYLVCMIIGTVILNGLTMKMVIRKIKFITEHSINKEMHARLEKRVIIRSYEQKIWLERHRFLSNVDWNQAFEMAGVISDIQDIEKKRKSSGNRFDQLEMTPTNGSNISH